MNDLFIIIILGNYSIIMFTQIGNKIIGKGKNIYLNNTQPNSPCLLFCEQVSKKWILF